MGSDRTAIALGVIRTQRRQTSKFDDRAALTGIPFVLKTGIPWEMLPRETGCGSGMTCCWRRLEERHEAGVWNRLRKTLLDRLGKANEIDRERASPDSASVSAPGGPKDRPEPDG